MKDKTDFTYENCGVTEEIFPCAGQCCGEKDAALLFPYAKFCPYCRISTSLPGGSSLKTTTIFECGRLGYGKRVTD